MGKQPNSHDQFPPWENKEWILDSKVGPIKFQESHFNWL